MVDFKGALIDADTIESGSHQYDGPPIAEFGRSLRESTDTNPVFVALDSYDEPSMPRLAVSIIGMRRVVPTDLPGEGVDSPKPPDFIMTGWVADCSSGLPPATYLVRLLARDAVRDGTVTTVFVENLTSASPQR